MVVHWSRHLLACIARVTRAKGLIGCRAVTFHPHYWWFSSPEEKSLWLAEDVACLADLRARLFARLPVQNLVLHARECWSEGQYVARPSQNATEI
jgi:hypothetical protein